MPYQYPFRLSHNSRWLYVLTVPWLVPVLGFALLGPAYGHRAATLLGASLVLGLLVSGWIVGLDQTHKAIVRRFPELPQTAPRVLLTAAACAVSGVLLLTLTASLFGYFHLFGASLTLAQLATGLGVLPTMQRWLAQLLGLTLPGWLLSGLVYAFDVVVIVLLAVAYEVFYSLRRWQESKLNTEQLRQASMQGQMQSLKNQINPHFLFNSLNSLSSLIADEPVRAEQFVDEMANVYRYLLQTNEQALTSLGIELGFIESYYHLLKTRHGAGLHLHIEVGDEHLPRQLPPLTLQMLVENAVKHNIILTDEPLHIAIAVTPGGQLRVSNNLQRKAARVESTHVGLSNITARYRLLGQPAPAIENGPAEFTVLLSLLD